MKAKGKINKETLTLKIKKIDILSCVCPALTCITKNSHGCKICARMTWSCSKEKNIPVKEMTVIKVQRDNVGSKEPH